MPKIKRLPPDVASAIAAGEVVERPASVLKELLENALDAGASKISVEVTGAGRKTLRVADDGAGMDPEDCALALERHATSKIAALGDLDELLSYGFRGEALFATAAVSRLTLTSALRGAKSGWKIEAEGGRVFSSSPAAAPGGTTVEVKDLFFNTPARHKFLKSDASEKSALVAVFEEAALANPGVHLAYKSEGRGTMNFAPQKSSDPLERFHLRLNDVLGGMTHDLVPVVMDRPEMKVWMFLSQPKSMAATRQFQQWFVNRRPVKAATLQQALYRAYREHRGEGRHPVCVAFLELPPEDFDANVHPGKREIRFKSEREVHELVTGLILQALSRTKTAEPVTVDAGASAVRETAPAYYLGGRSYFPEEPMLALKTEPAQELQAPAQAPRWYTPPYRYLGQIEQSYLVFEAAGGLFVLDQHAAAERILFEKYLREVTQSGAKGQKLMLPVPVELPASRVQEVLSHKAELLDLGFEVEPFGKTAVHVVCAPALFSKCEDLKEIVHRLLDSVTGPAAAARDAAHHAVSTIACKAAVKAHDALSQAEAIKLLTDLKDCADGSCCPHGRRAILALNREELARRFQRPGAPPL